MKKWLKRFLAKLETRSVAFFRSYRDEEYTAIVYNGNLIISKGVTVFMLGSCEEVIGKCFSPINKVGDL